MNLVLRVLVIMLLAWPLVALVVAHHWASARSRVPVRAFKAAHACPSTGVADADAPCPGYVVDHKDPLCAGGADTPENMQYEDYKASLVKDVLERKLCRLMAQLDACRAKLGPTP